MDRKRLLLEIVIFGLLFIWLPLMMQIICTVIASLIVEAALTYREKKRLSKMLRSSESIDKIVSTTNSLRNDNANP